MRGYVVCLSAGLCLSNCLQRSPGGRAVVRRHGCLRQHLLGGSYFPSCPINVERREVSQNNGVKMVSVDEREQQ